ncbi:3',5'-cyclic-nucleotide phosphodiesterase PDE1 [Aspergillus candidus]|uniref:cAMP phosphodiesterases class-II-domain-containing protein n=1 Tax=Aspergillus candidus TaxID=41067 RepID=A0A2I2FA07_ASPCN|nr:cAMP phosphodiesterases class-II-domain-containing protein [Aspergillus candidus]PLB37449.1 cAMP phosphodiesterases class-II-domain-containing protein [Aspergillus candidus]
MGRGHELGYYRACNGLLVKCLGISHGKCMKRHPPESTNPSQSNCVNYSPVPGEMGDAGTLSGMSPSFSTETHTTIDSSAFFIRDHATGREILIFGDVEPDSLSLNPRNKHVWYTAAPKIVNSDLRAIFIECSYNDGTEDCVLYGHLCPRHLIKELLVLAHRVFALRNPEQIPGDKRKRPSTPDVAGSQAVGKRAKSDAQYSLQGHSANPVTRTRSSSRRPSSGMGLDSLEISSNDPSTDNLTDVPWQSEDPPLSGLHVWIMHIKDDMTDGPPPGDRILRELREQANQVSLGCSFRIPDRGENIWI